MDCEEVREQLEAYALGALDAEAHGQIEKHLATCAECRRLAEEYAHLAARLPAALASVSPLQPSPELKLRVMRSVETQVASDVQAEAQRASTSTPKRTSFWQWFRGRWRRLAVTAALVGLLIAFGLWNLQLNTALSQERTLRAQLASLVDKQEIVLEVIDSPKTVKAILRPPAGSPSNAYGKLYIRPDLPDVVAMAARLQSPSSGQAYHLWLTRNGQTELAGVMKVNDQGFGLLVLHTGQIGPAYDSAQLTLQNVGSTTIAGDSVLIWQAQP